MTTSDLSVDTQRLRESAGSLDDAAAAFRRVDGGTARASFSSHAFGTSGAALEVADRIGRRLQHGFECTDLLEQRSLRLADGLRETAARFDEIEAALAGGHR